MNESRKAFLLGFFIILAVGLTALLILFLKPIPGDGKLRLKVRFSNIEKVTEGTLVTFAGRQVGKVYRIKTIENPRSAQADAAGNLYIYELILQVDSRVKVYLYDEIIFASAGLLGEKSIAIIPKASPAGAPPAYEVTHDILYAQSTDKFEQTLTKLVNVADTFQETLEEINFFIGTNNKEFTRSLQSLTKMSQEIHRFIDNINQSNIFIQATSILEKAERFFASAQDTMILDRLADSCDSLQEAACLFSNGQGTLGRLANSDNLYIQLTTVFSQLQTILSDMKNYGLLYQYDRKWQRMKEMRRSCTESPVASYCGK